MAYLLPKIVAQIKLMRHDSVPELFSDTGDILQLEPHLKVFEIADAFRKPDRFMELMQAAALLTEIGDIPIWQEQLDLLRNIDAGAIAKAAAGDVKLIKQNLCMARLQVLAGFYQL